MKNQITAGAILLLYLFYVGLFSAKLAGILSFSWVIILAPFWMPFILGSLFLFVLSLIVLGALGIMMVKG